MYSEKLQVITFQSAPMDAFFQYYLKTRYILDDANAQYKSFCKEEKDQKRFWDIWLSRYHSM